MKTPSSKYLHSSTMGKPLAGIGSLAAAFFPVVLLYLFGVGLPIPVLQKYPARHVDVTLPSMQKCPAGHGVHSSSVSRSV